MHSNAQTIIYKINNTFNKGYEKLKSWGSRRQFATYQEGMSLKHRKYLKTDHRVNCQKRKCDLMKMCRSFITEGFHYWWTLSLMWQYNTAAPDNSVGDNYIGLYQHHSLNISTSQSQHTAGDNTNHHQIKCFWPPGKWLELANITVRLTLKILKCNTAIIKLKNISIKSQVIFFMMFYLNNTY